MTSYAVCHLCDRAVRVDEFVGHLCFPVSAHQPREHAVRCVAHNLPTWRWDAMCPRCLLERDS